MSDATGNLSAAASQSHPLIPEDATIILPIRNTLLFPGIVLPLTITTPSSIAAVQEAVRGARKIGLLLQDDPNIERVLRQRSAEDRTVPGDSRGQEAAPGRHQRRDAG